MRPKYGFSIRSCSIAFLFFFAGLSCNGNTGEGFDTSTYETDYGEGDAFVDDVSVSIHAEVSTVLVVKWSQKAAADTVRIRYTFENDNWLSTPKHQGTLGPHEEVLLGVPENTAVRFYFEQSGENLLSDASVEDSSVDGGAAETVFFNGITGSLPKSLPRPTVLSFDPSFEGEEPWLLGSVENTPAEDGYYLGPFWIFIMDRKGRIVWYYSDRGDNPCMAFPRIARDNSHLYIEKRMFFDSERYTPKILQMTLDYGQMSEISVSELDDCFDVTDDGTLLFNSWSRASDTGLFERTPDGTTSFIWDCAAWAFKVGASALSSNYCYSNTVNWNPADDTVLLSFPYINSAVEIDRKTGALVSQWGDAEGSFRFEPDSWSFEFNHFANITPEGTLLISTHAPGHKDNEVAGEHRFVEFEIDRENRLLEEKWVYGEGVKDWPMFKGEAHRTKSGNTLVNYGTGGVIREVTPDGRTVWHVKFDADFEDDRFNKMVGHTILFDDLYSLNRGF